MKKLTLDEIKKAINLWCSKRNELEELNKFLLSGMNFKVLPESFAKDDYTHVYPGIHGNILYLFLVDSQKDIESGFKHEFIRQTCGEKILFDNLKHFSIPDTTFSHERVDEWNERIRRILLWNLCPDGLLHHFKIADPKGVNRIPEVFVVPTIDWNSVGYDPLLVFFATRKYDETLDPSEEKGVIQYYPDLIILNPDGFPINFALDTISQNDTAEDCVTPCPPFGGDKSLDKQGKQNKNFPPRPLETECYLLKLSRF